jgi:hypothetical protein
MTDDLERGLGALADSDDPRDYPIDALYAAEDAEPPELDALPSAYHVPFPLTPILDQGSSPMCVAYSTSWQKAYADRRDYLAWIDFAEPVFFHQIGGTERGAEVRWAMQRMVDAGYPVTGVPNAAAQHRIAAYYRIDAGPDMHGQIRQALATFHVPLVLSIAWYRSWFRPKADGTLPAPETLVGGHAIVVVGWREDGALLLANSWGTDWGEKGYCWLPKAYLSHARAAWRAVDVVDHPVPYKRAVVTKSRVNLRRAPRTTATKLGLIPQGASLITKQLEKYGGKYRGPDGAARTDWVQVTRGDHTGWIARAYTRSKT